MDESQHDYQQQEFSDNELDQGDKTYNPNLNAYLNYQRKPFTVSTDEPLYLMNIDVAGSCVKEFYQIKDQFGSYKSGVRKHPLIQIYSTTREGGSVCVNVRDFVPYFYVPFPSQWSADNDQNIQKLKKYLNSHMKDCKQAVTAITIIQAQSVMFYHPDQLAKQQKYMKIQTLSQAYIPQLRKIFQFGETINNFSIPHQTFQSNIPYILRFMIDKQIVGMGWFKIQPGFTIVQNCKKMTRCQLEIQASAHGIIPLPCQKQWSVIAPQRILSFDIQCAAQHGFPNPQQDSVIQIACICKTTTKQVQDYKVVFVLDGSSPISGVHVKNMKKQLDLLQDFQKLVITYDPDFILGYNMVNFDLKYIIQRAKYLTKHIRNYDFGHFSRNLKQKSVVKVGRLQSKAMGMRETTQINTDGRIQLDMLIHMQRQHKLTSYRLNNVSFQFLGDQKQDVHHSEITKLFKQSPQGRKRLAVYCLKDAQLPLKLMQKLCCLYNYSQMSRVTGVPINFLINRGQQIKVVSQLLRKTKKKNYIIPTKTIRGNPNQIGYEGAFVLDPKPGFYQCPIATLDFASLYPSIMMAHNLCYTTMVRQKDLQYYKLTEKQVTKTPEGYYFVKSNIRQGLLPQILNQLITARKKAKNQLAITTDPMLQKVLDGRQLALKTSANSVYGFTGATIGQLPCLQISSSVTSFGRQMIQKTRNLVIQKYKADVIYGDTDSVMVKFELRTTGTKQQQIAQAMCYGKQAALQISKQFIKPIKLQFQKVYCPFLLITKKRYAGVYYTKPNKHDKIDKKGIEAVRRDNCLLIRQILQNVLETILAQGNKQKAIKYIQQTIRDLLMNKIDISKLVITKAISKHTQQEDDKKQQPDKKQYKRAYKSKQAHTQLAQKMKKRDQNIQINIGDRIPYVIISGAKWSKNYQNAQDPIKVLDEDLPIDYDYYINKQIRPPLQRLLKNTHVVQNFDILFSGQHTKFRYAPKINEKSALGTYLKKIQCCEGCKRQADTVICSNCQDKITDIYLKKKDDVQMLKRQRNNMNIQCYSCQRFITEEVLCKNFDCPIFYRRKKVQKQLMEKQEHLQRFHIEFAW